MSTQIVADPVAVSTDATNGDQQKSSYLANQAELNNLMLEQINIAKRVETQRVEAAYSLYETLGDFLHSNKLSITDFIDICETRHHEIHGKKPVSLFKDINFSTSGKRTLPIKYRDKANPANLWSGRGKQPLWLTARIEEGYRAEDFLVENKKTIKKPKREVSNVKSTRSAAAAAKPQRQTASRPRKAKPEAPQTTA